jgi:hypothetical protein
MAIGKYENENCWSFLPGPTTAGEIQKMLRLFHAEPDETFRQNEVYARGRDSKREYFLSQPKRSATPKENNNK